MYQVGKETKYLFLESPARIDATAPTTRTSVFPIVICTRSSFALATLLRNPHEKTVYEAKRCTTNNLSKDDN